MATHDNAPQAPELQAVCHTASLACVDCKRRRGAAMAQQLDPCRGCRRRSEDRPVELQAVVRDGETRARAVAQATMNQVRGVMGLG